METRPVKIFLYSRELPDTYKSDTYESDSEYESNVLRIPCRSCKYLDLKLNKPIL